MGYIKKYYKYIFIFFMFLVWNLILVPLNLDEIWNYGFAHNVYNGLVPYKDFNIILTPLYPFIMSSLFFVFGSNLLVFHIEHALILTILSYFLFKMFNNKAWLIIMLLFLPLPVSFPSYNVFLFFLLVIVIYLEENKANDYLIGFLLGLIILTKQSVGVCLLLPSLYYFKDFKKIKKRFIGFILPVLVFLIYLICTNSFIQFLDLCLFGLFDFASDNGKVFNFYWVLFICLIGITLYFIKKDKNNIRNYYVLGFYSILIPLFDTYHFQIMFLAFLLLVLDKIKNNTIVNFKLLAIGIIIGVSCVTFVKKYDGNIMYPNNINHFEYRMIDSYGLNITNEVNNYIRKNNDKEFVFICSNGYYFKIINDMKITYLDLINSGNWGYNGSDKLYNELKKKKDAIFFVDESELSPIKQTDKRAIKYVLKNGDKIDSVGGYDIYVINK